jgi:hypothetical protein
VSALIPGGQFWPPASIKFLLGSSGGLVIIQAEQKKHAIKLTNNGKLT